MPRAVKFCLANNNKYNQKLLSSKTFEITVDHFKSFGEQKKKSQAADFFTRFSRNRKKFEQRRILIITKFNINLIFHFCDEVELLI